MRLFRRGAVRGDESPVPCDDLYGAPPEEGGVLLFVPPAPAPGS